MAEEFKKTLGFWSCFSVAVGLVVASTTLVSLGQGMGIGGGFLYAMIAAWLLQLFSAMTYGELATMLPGAGGISTYTLVAMGLWLFIGIEFVTPLAEETINPGRNLPWSMFTGLAIILVIKALFGLASLKYVPMADLAESTHPHVDMAGAIMDSGGSIWIGIVSRFIEIQKRSSAIFVSDRSGAALSGCSSPL